MFSNLKVTILGAGIVGINTALEFQARFPSAEITIVADKFDDETTSDGAAGLFDPSPSFKGPDLETTKAWIKHSYEHYSNLVHESCGVRIVDGYALANHDKKCVENPYLKPILPKYIRLGEDELAEISPGNWKYGTFMSTLSIASRCFLPWALKRFKEAGGRMLVCHIKNWSDLPEEADVVFNCTGLGAADLCNDMNVIPIRGQVIRIKEASINKFYLREYGTYIIPCGYNQMVTLGGTQNFGSWDQTADPFDTASILSRCSAIIPRLATYDGPQYVWTGLRPYRHKVRVEYEATPQFKVIHNYGHGGYGVTSAPGTARHAVNLFEKAHSSSVSASCIGQ